MVESLILRKMIGLGFLPGTDDAKKVLPGGY